MTAERRMPITTTDSGLSDEAPSENHEYHHPPPGRRLRQALSLMASPITDERGSPQSVLAGLCSLFIVGSMIGLVLPKNDALPTPWYRSVSSAVGYIYFLSWSVSFYPQVVSNFKRRSTVGLSPDFCILNVIGFACYASYNVSFFFSKTIQDLYKKRYGQDAEIPVQSNDVAFAVHALILSSITVLQIVYYGGGYGTLKLSKFLKVAVLMISLVCGTYLMLVIVSASSGKEKFNWLDFLYLLSYIKIGISLIKYIPQVILNHRRKSTVGWSIWNILLDFTGGILSVLQLVLDCADLNDFSGITGNPAKFALGFASIAFDSVFMIQHYCLYGHPAGDDHLVDGQREPLLPTSRVVDAASEQSPSPLGHDEEEDGSDGRRVAETIMV